MKNYTYTIALLVGLVMVPVGEARADVVYLDNGSKLFGSLQKIAEQTLVIKTEPAGKITIAQQAVIGIQTENAFHVLFESGDRLVGPLRVKEGRQFITQTSLGKVAIEIANIKALWPEDMAAPRIRELRQRVEKLQGDWSVEIGLGINGESGNNERLAISGRAQAKRETPDNRLLIFLEGNYARENGERTANEIVGGVRIEEDLSERIFAFGEIRLEYDEFENLNLRALATIGLGYFFIKEEHQELKGRLGVGYEHESFTNGVTEDDAILHIGYDYRVDIARYLRFTHSLTYYPTFHEPLENYRLVAETGIEVPISGDEAWTLRAGVQNEYDSEPQPGLEGLDTAYYLRLVYELE